METLAIINRNPSEVGFENFESKGVVWKTCLRQILFTTNENISLYKTIDSDKIYYSADAVSFLTDVLCGLQSPVFGETEVFGQFKNFIDTNPTFNNQILNNNTKWVRFTFELVKNIRTEFITNLGSNSYGSTLRKLTRDRDSLSIIGAGHLTTEILPWVAKNKKVQLLVRSKDKYTSLTKSYSNIQILELKSALSFDKALIIAAPIENSDLIALIEESNVKPEFIYDLRSSGFEELSQGLKNIKMLSLSDFFEIFNEDKKKFEQLKLKIRSQIEQRCEIYSNRLEIRPLGWDDLCL